MLNNTNIEQKYLLKTKFFEKEVKENDEIELIVQPEFRGYLRFGKYKYKKQDIDIAYVNYFNIEEFKMRYKQSRNINEIEEFIDLNIKNKKIEDYIFKKNIKEILENYKFYKKHLRFYPSIINYDEKITPIDPYYLGVWLGDGHSRSGNIITNIDKEVIDYLYEFAEKIDMCITHNDKYYNYFIINKIPKKSNKLNTIFKELNILKNKHIPNIFLYNSYEKRMELLAGLLDTDGTGNNTKSYYSFSQKDEKLFDQVRELVFSLGLLMSKDLYSSSKIINKEKRIYKCFEGIISGEDNLINNIPIKIKRKKINYKKKFNKHYLKYDIIEL
jgi:replicative DNA helicase